MSSNRTRFITAAVASALLIGLAGCDLLVGSNVTSFTVGYLLGSANAGNQMTCYQNGELINCADVPADLMP
jgi:hypothetical protein